MSLLHIQWAGSVLMPANSTAEITNTMLTWCTAPMPYTVPADKWLGITAAGFGSKFGAIGRASYFAVDNAFTLTDVEPSARWWPVPFIIPPGTVLHARFFNNELITPEGYPPEEQWMNFYMQGMLADYTGQPYGEAFL